MEIATRSSAGIADMVSIARISAVSSLTATFTIDMAFLPSIFFPCRSSLPWFDIRFFMIAFSNNRVDSLAGYYYIHAGIWKL